MSMVVNLLIAFLTWIAMLYMYMQWKLTYWKRRGLPHPKPYFPFGLYKFRNPKAVHIVEHIKEQYDYFKSKGHPHFGINLGTRPFYIPIHPELIKNIMVKDISYFPDRGIYHNEKDDPLGFNLVTMEGQKWKNMREKLNPIFTSSKTKMVFETFLNYSGRMISLMNRLSKEEDGVDMKEITSCYITDAIGSCILGIECNSFDGDKSEFIKCANELFLPLSFLAKMKWIIAVCNFKLGRFLRISLIPINITKFYFRVVRDNVEFRERTNFYRPDLMQLLIDLKKQNLTMPEVTAQCFILFGAATHTAASSITFCLYELAKNLDIQEKLRNEINEVIDENDEKFTYDNLNKIKYLQQVVAETLRMYPPFYVIPRQCIKNYKVLESDVIIEKGTHVFFPIWALHRDAEFFPEPDNFDPERFNKTNKAKIRPFTYLPFGEGPRICIASRFGLVQIQLGIAILLRHFRFTLNKKSPSLKLDPFVPMLHSKGPAWFNIEKLID